MELSTKLQNRLLELGRRLIDQQSSKVIIEPQGNSFGYWFGGGNLCLNNKGEVLVSGRFRNEGDARTGTGELGLEDWSVLYFQQALAILLLKKCFLSQRRFITHRGSCFDRGRFTDQNP